MLLGPNGQPISYKKEKPPKTGQAFGDWAGRDQNFLTLPGGSILNFDLSRLTLADYRAMRYNPQINASLCFLSFMIHQLDWWIDCEDSKIKDMIQQNLMDKWSQLIRAISQAHWAGYSPVVIDYENNLQTNKFEIGRFKDLLPEECEVEWETVEGYAPPGHIKPKFKRYNGIKHRMSQNSKIPAENTFWYPLMMENGDYYGRKLLKAAFTPWYFSTLIHLFANRYYERFGEPTRIGRAPLDENVPGPNGTSIPARDAMEGILSGIRNGAVVVLPNDKDVDTNNYEWAVEHLETQMRGVDFERYMARLDEEISLAIFTPILMFRTGTVGSNALGVQHVKTFLWMLNAIAADMKEYIDAYIIERIKGYNFGKNAPRVTWQWKPLGKENIETVRAIITEMIRQGTATVDVEELGKAIGMTVEEIKLANPGPDNDPEVPEPDERTGRGDRGNKPKTPPNSDKPSGSNQPVAARISSRVEGQLRRAWKAGQVGTNAFQPNIGHHRQVGELSTDSAKVDFFFASMEAYLSDVSTMNFDSPESYMEMFDRRLTMEMERLCEA